MIKWINLRKVLQVLKHNKLFAKFSKFLLRSVAFLGNMVSNEGVKVDLRKIEVVKNFSLTLESYRHS